MCRSVAFGARPSKVGVATDDVGGPDMGMGFERSCVCIAQEGAGTSTSSQYRELIQGLKFYDDELRATICSSFNIQLAESAPSWTQSTLLVHHGGLGIRSAVQLAPSAFLVSAAASSGLAYLILPANMQPLQLSYVDEALAAWSQGCQEQPPTDAAAHHQKTWDLVSDLGSLVQAMGAMWVGGGSGQGGSRRSGGGGTGANTVSVLLLLLLLAVWAALLLLAADANRCSEVESVADPGFEGELQVLVNLSKVFQIAYWDFFELSKAEAWNHSRFCSLFQCMQDFRPSSSFCTERPESLNSDRCADSECGCYNDLMESCDKGLHDLYYSNEVQQFLNSTSSKELNAHKAIYTAATARMP
ncbi:hypothetical protein EMCRGX_G000911 [Ephydatia muelleri]